MGVGESYKLNIVFVSRYPPMHCGVAEYTRHLISAMHSIASWNKFAVLTSTVEGNKSWYDEVLDVKVIPAFSEQDRSYRKLLDELGYMDRTDILHVEHEYGIFGESLKLVEAVKTAREEKLVRKAVITMHTVTHPSSGDKRGVFQMHLNEFDAVVVHSILQEFELQCQGVDPRKIYRIPHGTLINPYLEFPRQVLAESLGIATESLKGAVIAIPGFLRPDKGIDILFSALSYLKGIDKTVLVAGEPRDQRIVELIEELREEHNIILMDRYLSSDEILRVIGLADILVLPYRDKPGTYSVSGILHLSMGGLKPIIGSRTPRLVELYQYVPRLTVPPGDCVELAKRIKWVINNYDYAVPYMATLYGYAARTQWIRMARRHLKLYRRILAGEHPGRAIEEI